MPNRYLDALERQQAQAAEHTVIGETTPHEGMATAEMLQRAVGLDPAELIDAAGRYCMDELGCDPAGPIGRHVAVAFVTGAEAAAAVAAEMFVSFGLDPATRRVVSDDHGKRPRFWPTPDDHGEQ